MRPGAGTERRVCGGAQAGHIGRGCCSRSGLAGTMAAVGKNKKGRERGAPSGGGAQTEGKFALICITPN